MILYRKCNHCSTIIKIDTKSEGPYPCIITDTSEKFNICKGQLTIESNEEEFKIHNRLY